MAFGKATAAGQAVEVGGEDATQLSVGAIVPASAVNNANFTLSVIELPPNYGKAVEILRQSPNESTAEILSPVASVTAHDTDTGEELPVKGSPEDVVVSFLAPASDANVSCAYYDEVCLCFRQECLKAFVLQCLSPLSLFFVCMCVCVRVCVRARARVCACLGKQALEGKGRQASSER